MSVVYFITAGPCIKIGISTNLRSRFASLQTSSMDELRLLGTVPGGIEREREIHRSLEKYRRRGEWFLDCLEVREAIIKLCGRDVFVAIEEPPQPTPPKPLRDVLDGLMEDTKARFCSFSNFCLEGIENKTGRIWRLHVTKRHLVMAAIEYARNAIEREDTHFAVHQSDRDAVGRATASGEMCECHVEMIVGTDVWFLDGWEARQRDNPLFETLNGQPRWETRHEAYAAGWIGPENSFMSLVGAAA